MKKQVLFFTLFALLVTVKGQFDRATIKNDK